MTESYSPILIQKVMAAELDFAVVPAFMGSRGLKVQHFLRTWETLVASPDKKMHLRRTRLRDVGPLKIVLPSHANARRKPLETYFTTNGVDIERIVEMDAMMGTLDLVSKSDWVTIIPALMMTAEIERMQFSVVPLVDPTAPSRFGGDRADASHAQRCRARVSRNSPRRSGGPQQSMAPIFRLSQP